MKLYIIEGLDGSGGTTQTQLLIDILRKKGLKADTLHFPDYDEKYTGELISKYLRGEFKDIPQSLLYYVYSCNRLLSKDTLLQLMKTNDIVILNRYVTSSMVYQGIFMENISSEDLKTDEIDKKLERIYTLMTNLEYSIFSLPIPTKEFYLDVSFDVIKEHLEERRINNDRDYLKGKEDIHENNYPYLKLIDELYKKIFEKYNDNKVIIDCMNNDKLKKPEEISKMILKHLEE